MSLIILMIIWYYIGCFMLVMMDGFYDNTAELIIMTIIRPAAPLLVVPYMIGAFLIEKLKALKEKVSNGHS